MAGNRTRETDASVEAFLNGVENDIRRQDVLESLIADSWETAREKFGEPDPVSDA